VKWAREYSLLSAAYQDLKARLANLESEVARQQLVNDDVVTIRRLVVRAETDLQQVHALLVGTTSSNGLLRVVHELNNTLTALIALAALAREEVTDGACLHALREIEQAARALTQFARELSALALNSPGGS
jgi:hypothetical protein